MEKSEEFESQAFLTVPTWENLGAPPVLWNAQLGINGPNCRHLPTTENLGLTTYCCCRTAKNCGMVHQLYSVRISGYTQLQLRCWIIRCLHCSWSILTEGKYWSLSVSSNPTNLVVSWFHVLRSLPFSSALENNDFATQIITRQSANTPRISDFCVCVRWALHFLTRLLLRFCHKTKCFRTGES